MLKILRTEPNLQRLATAEAQPATPSNVHREQTGYGILLYICISVFTAIMERTKITCVVVQASTLPAASQPQPRNTLFTIPWEIYGLLVLLEGNRGRFILW